MHQLSTKYGCHHPLVWSYHIWKKQIVFISCWIFSHCHGTLKLPVDALWSASTHQFLIMPIIMCVFYLCRSSGWMMLRPASSSAAGTRSTELLPWVILTEISPGSHKKPLRNNENHSVLPTIVPSCISRDTLSGIFCFELQIAFSFCISSSAGSPDDFEGLGSKRLCSKLSSLCPDPQTRK